MTSHPIANGTKRAAPDGQILSVRNLRVETAGGLPIVDGVSLAVERGETLGIVGESGSGKTTAVLSLLGFTQSGARITGGEVEVAGEKLIVDDRASLRSIRGRLISYVPQNPGTALNPSRRIGEAIAEMIRAHPTAYAGGQAATSREAIGDVLESVGLPRDKEFQRRYPHQLSGGQQQRVCIATALVCRPPVVVLDEPTTGLDVITQATILDELSRLSDESNISMIYVSHDLAVVAQIADHVAVMYAGRIVEQGPTEQILSHPRHPYTRGLLMTLPDHVEPRGLLPLDGVALGVGEWPQGCGFAPRCQMRVDGCEVAVPAIREVAPDHGVRCIRAEEVSDPAQPPLSQVHSAPADRAPLLDVTSLAVEHRGRDSRLIVARDVSFQLMPGECVAMVGESGSGKTTIARAIAGLHPISGGEVKLAGDLLVGTAPKRSIEQRRRIQMIFQNPSDAINPKLKIGATISRPARLLRGLSGQESETIMLDLLEQVRLPAHTAERYPGELSGGERQRVGIARALAAGPELLICDEVTSALDVSVQAAVLDLLDELRRELQLSLLFITHDFGTVATIANRVLVLEKGVVCESGPTEAVLRHPQNEYTDRLLEAAPSISRAHAAWAQSQPTE